MKKNLSNNKKIPTELDGSRILVRRFRLCDAEDVYQNCKSREIAHWTLALPHPYPKDGAGKYILSCQRKWRAKKEFSMAVVDKESNRVAGSIGLRNIDFKHQTAELGYLIGKKYWNQGYATEAVRLILQFGFSDLNLYRIYAGVFEPNIASWKVLEKFGFRREGCWREAIVKHNKRQNLMHYAILKPEYERLIQKKGIRRT